MKIICLLLALFICFPAHAAQESESVPAAAARTGDTPASPAQKELAPNEYACKFYSVNLPDDWTAITPPTEQQGNINAIFASNSMSSVITIVVGPNGGADARTVATMFAEQFNATKPPVERNGRFSFTFPYQGMNAQAYIGVAGRDFMVIAIYGKIQEARDFLGKCVKSEEFGFLMQ